MSVIPTLSSENFRLDTSVASAFQEVVESNWVNKFSVYSISRDFILRCTDDDLLDYFITKHPDMKFKVFYGRSAYLWNDDTSIRFVS